MTLTLLLTAAAHVALAGPSWLTGAAGARSVLVLPDGRPDQAAICADDGSNGDPLPGDGVWRCAGPQAEAAEWRVLLDGMRLQVIRGDAPQGVYGLDLESGGGTLRPGPAPTGTPGTPRPATPALLMEVDRGPIQQAPVVELLSRGARAQLTCRDDGRFPDRAQNDAVASCAGAAPGQILEIRVRGGWEEQVFNLSFPAEAVLMQARLGASGIVADRWVLSEQATGGAPVGTPPPGATPQQAAPGPTAPPGAPEGLGVGAAAALAALTGGLGLALGRRSRRAGLPPGLAWAVAPDRAGVERLDRPPTALAEVVQDHARRGVVVVLAGPAPLPPGEPGPVLRATSADALDLADALCALRRAGELRPIRVVVEREELIESPGEVGLRPLERLLAHAPPGVQVVLLAGEDPSRPRLDV